MKPAIEKLFRSPASNGFLDSPGFFFALGAGLLIFAIDGAVTGQIALGAKGTFAITYAAKPKFFLFMLAAMGALGAAALYRGYRRWRAHDNDGSA